MPEQPQYREKVRRAAEAIAAGGEAVSYAAIGRLTRLGPKQIKDQITRLKKKGRWPHGDLRRKAVGFCSRHIKATTAPRAAWRATGDAWVRQGRRKPPQPHCHKVRAVDMSEWRARVGLSLHNRFAPTPPPAYAGPSVDLMVREWRAMRAKKGRNKRTAAS
jgi:hypothetical protein